MQRPETSSLRDKTEEQRPARALLQRLLLLLKMKMTGYRGVSLVPADNNMYINNLNNGWLAHTSNRTTAPEAADPGLFKKHSTYQSYTTSVATYPSIRTFFCPHPHIDKLPTTPAPLPLLVFVHGLGGSATQFNAILTSLVNVGPCFSIDFPGCGLSAFEPTQWDAYALDALVELLAVAIERHRDKERGQKVVLVAHSAGCSISAALIAALARDTTTTTAGAEHLENTTNRNTSTNTNANRYGNDAEEGGAEGGEKTATGTEAGAGAGTESSVCRSCRNSVIGLIAICPVAEPPTGKDLALHRRLLHVPSMIFDMWRRWDRRGGLESTSVARMVGAGASPDTRRLQMQYNYNVKTPVWKRMAWGLLPQPQQNVSSSSSSAAAEASATNTTAGADTGVIATSGLPGKKVWEMVRVPVLLIGGEADTVTRPTEVKKILKFLRHPTTSSVPAGPAGDEPVAVGAGAGTGDAAASLVEELRISPEEPTTTTTAATGGGASETPAAGNRKVKAFIFPAPASHALLYDTNTFRTLCGLIQNFLFKHVDERLSIGWQLQHLTTSGKWDVKNLRKWQAVEPVSRPIGRPDGGEGDDDYYDDEAGVFVAMKTLREVDETHTPVKFVKTWRGKIYAIIDIGHQSPVYDPAQLEKGGIQYHKFPTVSKIPPTRDEVREFIALVDRLRAEIAARRHSNQPHARSSSSSQLPQQPQQQPSSTSTLTSSSSSSSSKTAAPSSNHSPPSPMIAVHCHYGFNRTGFFVVTYMIERLGYDVQAALDEFERLRYPGIRHQHFVDTLFMRYCVGLTRATTGGSV